MRCREEATGFREKRTSKNLPVSSNTVQRCMWKSIRYSTVCTNKNFSVYQNKVLWRFLYRGNYVVMKKNEETLFFLCWWGRALHCFTTRDWGGSSRGAQGRERGQVRASVGSKGTCPLQRI